MPAKTLSKPKKKLSECPKEVTLEEYRSEIQAAENADFIRFEDHKKNMNKWLEMKL